MCYYYTCEVKFDFFKDNRAISFLRIYKGKELWSRRFIEEKVISQIKIKLRGTKNTLRNAHPIFIKEMNTAIRKAKKAYPNLKKF